MTRPDSWSRITQVAEQRRDASASAFARLATRARDAQKKLDLLIEYRLDYRGRFEKASRTGMPGEWLRNYQNFIANLEQAITQQTKALTTLQHEVAEAKTRVDATQRRVESYQIIDERRGSAGLTHERRLEQRQQDEMAIRASPKMFAYGEI